MRSRRWWIAALAAVIIGGVGTVVLTDRSGSGCPDAAVAVGQVPAVFANSHAAVVRTDPALVRLIAAIQDSGLGRVQGAIGFDQTHYLRTAGLPDGFATWTQDNAVVGFRDRSGAPRWGLRQTTDPQGWAVLGNTFVSLDLRPRKPLRVVAYRNGSGSVAWCAAIAPTTKAGDPLTVASGLAGSTWVVSAGPTLTHLASSGRILAQARVAAMDRGAFVKQVGSLLVVGGRRSPLLTAPDPRAPAPTGPAVAALDAQTLRPRWTWGVGLTAHVLGENDGLVIVEVARPVGLSLVALDLNGRQRWSVTLAPGTTGDMVVLPSWQAALVRSDRDLTAYDIGTGSPLWSRRLASVAAFPEGFDLAAQPRVGKELLLGTSSALVTLRADGSITRYGLPEHATDFWPYEIAVSGRSAVVATGVGAVLLALRPGA